MFAVRLISAAQIVFSLHFSEFVAHNKKENSYQVSHSPCFYYIPFSTFLWISHISLLLLFSWFSLSFAILFLLLLFYSFLSLIPTKLNVVHDIASLSTFKHIQYRKPIPYFRRTFSSESLTQSFIFSHRSLALCDCKCKRTQHGRSHTDIQCKEKNIVHVFEILFSIPNIIRKEVIYSRAKMELVWYCAVC